LQNLDAAISDYWVALSLAADDVDTQYQLGCSYYNRGLQNAEAGLYAKAIQDFTLALQFNAQSAEVYGARALSYYRNQDYDNAMLDCLNACRLNPFLAEVYLRKTSAARDEM